MNDNSQGTNQESVDEQIPWSELSDPVQSMVLVRIRALITEVEIDVADEQVKALAMRHSMANAYQAAQSQMKEPIPDEMARTMAAMQDEMYAGMGADRQLLLQALVAAFNELSSVSKGNGASEHDTLSLGTGAGWPDLCTELSLDPTTATPEDVITMVRRLKARTEPAPAEAQQAG